MLVKPTNPCGRYCKDRKIGCGSDCTAWKKYVIARDEWYEKKFAENNAKYACHRAKRN